MKGLLFGVIVETAAPTAAMALRDCQWVLYSNEESRLVYIIATQSRIYEITRRTKYAVLIFTGNVVKK